MHFWAQSYICILKVNVNIAFWITLQPVNFIQLHIWGLHIWGRIMSAVCYCSVPSLLMYLNNDERASLHTIVCVQLWTLPVQRSVKAMFQTHICQANANGEEWWASTDSSWLLPWWSILSTIPPTSPLPPPTFEVWRMICFTLWTDGTPGENLWV